MRIAAVLGHEQEPAGTGFRKARPSASAVRSEVPLLAGDRRRRSKVQLLAPDGGGGGGAGPHRADGAPGAAAGGVHRSIIFNIFVIYWTDMCVRFIFTGFYLFSFGIFVIIGLTCLPVRSQYL